MPTQDELRGMVIAIFSAFDTLSRSVAPAPFLRSVGYGDLRTMTGSRHYDLRGNSAEDVAGWVGGQYGFELAAIHGGAYIEDFLWEKAGITKAAVWVYPPPTDADKAAELKEKMDWVLVHDPTCNPLSDWYFDARWEYANTIARAVNPFEPELEDEGNLSSALGVFDMFCRVYRHEENLSNFTKWFVAFFDASVKGGAVYEGIMFAASMLPFPSPAMVAKLGATLAKMGRAVIGAMKALWKGIKAVGGAVRASLTTMATRVADLAVSSWHSIQSGVQDLLTWTKNIGLPGFTRSARMAKESPGVASGLAGGRANSLLELCAICGVFKSGGAPLGEDLARAWALPGGVELVGKTKYAAEFARAEFKMEFDLVEESKSLIGHFDNHALDAGIQAATPGEYLQKARNLLREALEETPGRALFRRPSDGALIAVDHATTGVVPATGIVDKIGTIAVYDAKSGRLLTYFTPAKGLKYAERLAKAENWLPALGAP